MRTAPSDPFHRALHTWRLVRDPIRLLRELAARHGDPFVMPTLYEPLVVTGDPRWVREIFAASAEVMDPPSGVVEPLVGERSVVLARGARHRRKRRLLAPPLHGARMRVYGATIAEAARRAFAGLRPGEPVDVLARTQRLSLDVIVKAVFGLEEPSRIAAFQASVTEVIEAFPAWLMFSPLLHRELGGRGPWARYQRAVRRFVGLLREEIHRGGAREDILSLLLAARDEDGAPLAEDELVDELRTLVIAGHETTATTLGWALDRLHRDGRVLTRLCAELAPLGPTPAAEALASLPYLGAVCDETLRLHPIVPIMARRTVARWSLAGHAVAAGATVCPAVMITHFDAGLYPDPETFRPERFLGARPGPAEFYPFGGGDRRCVGAAMATYELKIALGTVLAAQRFAPLAGQPIPLVMNGVTTRPRRPIRLTSLGARSWQSSSR